MTFSIIHFLLIFNTTRCRLRIQEWQHYICNSLDLLKKLAFFSNLMIIYVFLFNLNEKYINIIKHFNIK